MPHHRSLHLDADGTRLSGEWFGEPSDRPLIFTHGVGQTAAAWRRTASRVAATGWSALAVDARGHGRSDRNPPDQPYVPDQFAEDLHRWTRMFQRKPVLIGASMGGLTGLVAQARYDCFAALVLVDVTPRWESEGVARILDFMRAHGDGFVSIDAAADAIAAYMPHRPRKSAQALAGLLEPDADGRWRWHWDPRLVDDLSAGMEGHQHQVSEAARQVGVPTLLLTGSDSDVVSRDTIDHFLALVPHAQHREIAGARHLVAGDDNDAFASAVIEFLQPLALRSAA